MDTERDQTTEALERIANFQKQCGQYGLSISSMGLFGATSSLILVKAQEHRNRMVQEPEILDWFQAIAEVFDLLRILSSGFANNELLSQASFLIDRVQSDIESIAELAMGGLQGAAFDVIRDLLEIESLLKDFLAHPGNMEEWLKGDNSNKFKPVELRKREQIITGVPTEEMRSKQIYSVHSDALHVNPELSFNTVRGIQLFDHVRSKWPFYDLFYHLAWLVPILMIYGNNFSDPQKEAVSEAELGTFHKVLAGVADALSDLSQTQLDNKSAD